MSKLKNNKGITLVALIITIIVLLILAMVSINLVMNGGIIDKSKHAVDKYSQEEIQEQAKDFMQEKLRTTLGDNGLTVKEKNGVLQVTLSNGKVYDYNVSTGVASEGVEEGKVKFGNLTLGVGDQVNYDPTLNAPAGTTTYTSYSASNASSDKNSGRTSGCH